MTDEPVFPERTINIGIPPTPDQVVVMYFKPAPDGDTSAIAWAGLPLANLSIFMRELTDAYANGTVYPPVESVTNPVPREPVAGERVSDIADFYKYYNRRKYGDQ